MELIVFYVVVSVVIVGVSMIYEWVRETVSDRLFGFRYDRWKRKQ